MQEYETLWIHGWIGRSVVLDDFEQRAVNFKAPFAVNQAPLTEPILLGGTYVKSFPLIFAIGKGNKQAVTILLGAGASTSVKTPDGLTLVELANQKQQTEIAQLLTESIKTGGAPSSGPIYEPRTFRVDPKASQQPKR